jgi:hypothetical protein
MSKCAKCNITLSDDEEIEILIRNTKSMIIEHVYYYNKCNISEYPLCLDCLVYEMIKIENLKK